MSSLLGTPCCLRVQGLGVLKVCLGTRHLGLFGLGFSGLGFRDIWHETLWMIACPHLRARVRAKTKQCVEGLRILNPKASRVRRGIEH